MRRSLFQGAFAKPTYDGIAVCMICLLDPVHALRSAGHPPTRDPMIYRRRPRLTKADLRLQSWCSPDAPLATFAVLFADLTGERQLRTVRKGGPNNRTANVSGDCRVGSKDFCEATWGTH